MSNLTPLLYSIIGFLALLVVIGIHQLESMYRKLAEARRNFFEIEAKNRIQVQHIELIGKSLGHCTAARNEINIHLFGDVRSRTMEEIIAKIDDLKVSNASRTASSILNDEEEQRRQRLPDEYGTSLS